MDTTTRVTVEIAAKRRLIWTRLGRMLGYTDTSAKRDEIRGAVEAMTWVEPSELADIVDTPPIQHLIASLFYQRPWALHLAASVRLPQDPAGQERRVIGLQSVAGDRYVLLSAGCEVVDVLHEAPACQRMTR